MCDRRWNEQVWALCNGPEEKNWSHPFYTRLDNERMRDEGREGDAVHRNFGWIQPLEIIVTR